MKLRVRFPDSQEVCDLELAKKRVRLGRDPACDVAIDSQRFPKVSGIHAELATRQNAVWLLHRSKSNSTVMGDEAITKPLQLTSGDRFRLGFTGPEIEFVSAEIREETQFSAKASDFVDERQLATENFVIGDGGILGRAEGVTFQLRHPHVSRRHAAIRVTGESVQIKDLGSSNGTYVDGRRITKPTFIDAGSTLDIGPFSLVFDGTSLRSRSRANNVQLDVSQLSFTVPDTTARRKLQLLNDVSFSVTPGEFVAVVGPSGSGKSTLLRAISGRSWPSGGEVCLNGRNLHDQFAAMKEDLVVVPQSPTFHATLSVWQSIEYTAALRLPADTSSEELATSVSASLSQVGLEDHAETRVGKLSGGQLKRLGLASELISDPSLIFLDEVTSGLDEQGDREIMDLFRRLAEPGKTVVCVTHNLSHIAANCHKVLVLTEGGRVAFFGTPEQCLEYFGIKQLGEVYSVLKSKRANVWQAAFIASPFFEPPSTEFETVPASATSKSKPREIIRRVGLKPLSQVLTLVRRYVAVWLGDPAALLALFGQPCLVAVLLCLVFNAIPGEDVPSEHFKRQTEIRNLLFLLAVSSFWLGANTAAKEIVRERQIYERERAFNLIPEAFLCSKLIVLSLICLLQTLLLTTIVAAWCGIPGSLLAITGVSFFLSITGTALGLAISANSKSEEFAAALVPVAIIPQIILAGVVAALSGIALQLAKVGTTVFWGLKLFEGLLPTSDRLEATFEPTIGTCLTVMGIHALVFVAIAGWGVRFRTLGGD